ncbi:MAG: sulfite exporter TauE/SafE family protein [Owenweeksia sp.]|nr:sulfite exporter TauE/SafE family protein [Owenweeksia sp.]
MCHMEILGYVLAMVMGFTLGLLGGGGSILTVPILVYALAIDPVLATGYSLFVVGTSAVVGAVRKGLEKLVDWKIALTFAIPSLLAVFATRYFIMPAIPAIIYRANDFVLSKNMAIMVFFALVMLMAAFSMMRNGIAEKSRGAKKFNYTLIILEGLVVGLVTGLVGAGGGFLIVPALVLMVGLPIKKAVGTSLVIIAIKSLIGFLGDVGSGQAIEWSFMLLFTTFSVVGMFAGIWATRYIGAQRLKNIFGWFILLMAIFIIVKELMNF